MRVRSLRALGLISVCTMVPLACTSILGDYAIGAGPATNDGGMDGLVAQETSGMDAPNDAAADASPYVKLTCAEATTSRFLLGSFTTTNGPDRIWAMARPANVIRAVVSDKGGQTHTFTYRSDMGRNATVTESPLMEQPISVKSYPGGIAALIQSFVSLSDGGQSPVLKIIKLPDGSSTWTPGLPVTARGDLDCQSRLGATFEIVDEVTDNYLVAYTYAMSNSLSCPQTPPRIFGRHQKGTDGTTNEWTLPPVALAGGNSGLEFLSESIAIDGSDVYVVVNANGSSGPPAAGSGPALYKTTFDMGNVPSGTFALKSPADFMFGVAVAGRQAGKINLGFLEADLGSSTATPEMYVGQVPGGSVVGLTPSAGLATTVVPGLPDLIVDKARFHWDRFASPASENLIAIGPQLGNLTMPTGANFMWWDSEGRVRGQRTGTMTNLLAGEPIYGVDAVFTSPPLIQIADLQVIFTKAGADASPNVIDVWSTDVSCLKL